MPEFRVGYMGLGIGNRRNLPFVLYDHPESAGWGQSYLEDVWHDFSGGEDGVIITLDDVSRRDWFALGNGYLGEGRTFQKWGYFPVDSYGPNYARLPAYSRRIMDSYDRVLIASEWGAEVAERKGDWLPHGIFTDTFKPSPRKEDDGVIQVGCVMANQSRKDFPVAFECFKLLKREYGNRFKAWLHTDVLVRHWSAPNLAIDYGVADCTEITTTQVSDGALAAAYSSCACTILPSGGEGFGYPIVESMACGTPCIVTRYGAGAELTYPDCWVVPIGLRVDTQHNVARAVIRGEDFYLRCRAVIEDRLCNWNDTSDRMVERVAHLDWTRLNYPWMRWLREGLCTR
jgi:glycosyltransferase involved in cell wall biosynthesis